MVKRPKTAKGTITKKRKDGTSKPISAPQARLRLGRLGYDIVEMVLAEQDGWDRYEAAKWLTMRRRLDANPDDEAVEEVGAEPTSGPERYAAYTREYLGWGVFALMSSR